jgi:aminoglycoside phosphotransferase (APT) family kinase protein
VHTFDIRGNSMVEVAADFKKRPHVLRLRPSAQTEVLMQAKNDEEMYEWIALIQKVCKSNSISQ